MSHAPSDIERDPPLPDFVEEAGEWLFKLSDAEFDPELLNDWLEWYQASPMNREAFDQMLLEYKRLRSASIAQRIYMATHAMSPRHASRAPVAQHVPAPVVVKRTPRLRQRRHWIGALAAGVIVAVCVGYLNRGVLPHAPDNEMGTVQTVRGAHETHRLPDGSELTLGGESAATYRFTAKERHIVLESGEAYFAVAKDKSRPFIVNVGGMTVRAVGTAFNIRRSTEQVVVTVTEGIVDVQRVAALAANPASSARPPVHVLRLKAGQEVVVDAGDALRRPLLRTANPEVASAWKDGRLEFVNEPLSSVVDTVNRYSDREIVIIDRELTSMPMTGSIMQDHIDEWLASLPDLYPAKVEVVGHRTVLISLAAFKEPGTAAAAIVP